MIWPGVSSNGGANELAHHLAAAFTAPFVLEVGTVTISASIGVAVGGAPQSGEDLLLAANAAMRDAKRRGPDRTSVYTSRMQDDAQSRIRVEAEIRAGMARSEFVLHYQPIVDLQKRIVTGVEALVRWNHPDGLRMPDSFIPIAEQSGLMVPLGAWIVDEACRQAAAWRAGGLHLSMAVNLSVRQMADPGLLSVVERALCRAQLPPECLLLEITESAAIEDAELALTTLVSLDALGVGIAIDDFGTGYSTLLYLKRYPIHALKIDRAFIAGLGINSKDDAIVASVVSLARGANAVCIAEGVETAAQAAALSRLGCNSAQGYLYARPAAAEAIPDVVAQCDQQLHLSLLVPRQGSRAPHEVPRSVLHRMDELLKRGASLHTIAAALNCDSSRGPGGVRWSKATVGRVLEANSMQLQDQAIARVATMPSRAASANLRLVPGRRAEALASGT